MITAINAYSPQQKNTISPSFEKRPWNKRFLDRKAEDVNHAVTNFDTWVAKIANFTPLKKAVEWATKTGNKKTRSGKLVEFDNSEKISQFMMVGYSAFLQTNHVINIMKNKQMPEERKETLAVNNILAFILPTIGAFTVDNSINKASKNFEKYLKKLNGPKMNKDMVTGLKHAKSLFIFTMMYKYASTIVTTPMAETTTKWLHQKELLPSDRKAKKAAAQKKEIIA